MKRLTLYVIAALTTISAVAQPTFSYLNTLNQRSQNSGQVEKVLLGPWLDTSGKSMVFVQESAIYFTTKGSNGTWQKPQSIPGEDIDKRDVAGFDGRRLYIADRTGGGFSYIEIMPNGSWSRPRLAFTYKCLASAPADFPEERFAISPDAGLLVYTYRDKPASTSKSKLFYATGKSGKYSNCQPVTQHALGAEVRPAILHDNRTLLYTVLSEQWKDAATKSPVETQYATMLQDDGSWSVPQLIAGSDYFYTWASRRTDTAYFRTKSGRIGFAVDPKGIIRQSEPEAQPKQSELTTRATELAVTPTSPAPKITGHYYALLIGVSDYEVDKLDIATPIEDVQAVKRVLTSHYSFDESKITVLNNPSRQAIFKELFRLRTAIGDHDNLLIFYAGHGFWDDRVEQGYWIPSNGRPDEPSDWLSNSDLREQIRGINTAHTLLISDACFSGGIFRTRSTSEIRSAPMEIAALYKMRSRRAITSGTLSTVPANSVFTQYLLKRLEENDEKYLSSQSLFNSMRMAVINNSFAVPQEGVINDTGDEGGDFIFIHR